MKWMQKATKLANRWVPPLFWGAMLVGHFPLILRVCYKISLGIELAQSGKSLLTLLVASAFFLFKMRGGRIIMTRPTLFQIVAFCLLGVFLHLFLFPPIVLDNPYEFLLLKCLIATATGLATLLLIHLIRSRRRLEANLAAWIDSHRFRLSPNRDGTLDLLPLPQTAPVRAVVRRGPPSLPLR